MNGKLYDVRILYVMLKLGIWRQGQVAGWGHVSVTDSDISRNIGNRIRFNTGKYSDNPLIRKHLDIGLYLLDIYCLYSLPDTHSYSHVVVIAVCRTTVDKIEKIYTLRVTNELDLEQFSQNLLSDTAMIPMRARKSILRSSKTTRRFDNKPIHSEIRRH